MVSFSDFSPWLWGHSPPFKDISIEAVTGTQAQYDQWAVGFRAILQAKVDAVPISLSSPAAIGTPSIRSGYSLKRIDVPFPSGPTIQTLLAIPDVIDADKPLIVGISGHEVALGVAPEAIFQPGGWGEKWAQAGYVVYAPSNCWYSQLGVFSNGVVACHDYHAAWVKMHTRLWARIQPLLPSFSGRVATGLSSGSLTAAWWAALDDGFDLVCLAAHHVTLDFLRENYRIAGTPNSWDIKSLLSYTGLFSLLSPRPFQTQIGQLDAFYPDLMADVAQQPYYPGLPRPPSTDEFLGMAMIYERIWARSDGRFDLHVHSGGHVYDFDAARAFVEA
ncbi:hypothetical protein ACVITL_002783 [Rhizobium pisi]